MNAKERKITTELAAINQRLQGQNSEKKIAQAILDAQVMREASFVPTVNRGQYESHGEYKLDIEECLIATCKKHDLSENLWCLLNLAMHWWNDIQLWAEDVLAGKNILEECKKEAAKMQDGVKRVGEVDENYEQAVADIKPGYMNRVGEADDDGLEKDT